MKNGIVCKVWNISGDSEKKSSSSQIKDSIGYILNDEKTEIKLSEENISSFNSKQLGRECKYIENDIKTVEGAYVGSRNLTTTDISEAVQEMMNVKQFYEKMNGRAALHGIISLPVEESDIERSADLMALCNDVLAEIFPNHQAVFAVHTNTENLHIHFIVNSVGLDGRKIHQPKNFVRDVLHPSVNKHAEKYGFTPNSEWNKEVKIENLNYVEIKMNLRSMIDIAIENADNIEDFIKNMELAGADVRIGKFISIKTEDMNKAVRSYQLGTNYTKDSIIERIQTRKQAFESIQINSYVNLKETAKDIFSPNTNEMKKYKNMSPTEKKEVIKKLKLGQNPWRIHQTTKWQLKNISDDLNMAYRARDYLKKYSIDGSAENALNRILEIKKMLSTEKKELKERFQLYKPMVDIYREMQLIERKAYLYEHEGVQEYRTEYEKYRELTRRLKNGYGKTVEDVKNIIDEYNNQLIYANAQLEELSLEYREIKKFFKVKATDKIENSLIDLIGLSKNQQMARKGVFDADISYVCSPDNPNIVVKIVKSPYVDSSGHTKENVSVSVLSKYGEVFESCDLKDSNKEFREFITKIEKEYDFTNCQSFKDITLASTFIDGCKSSSSEKVSNIKSSKQTDLKKERKSYSFTQAVNLLSTKNKKGIYVITNSLNPNYMGVVSSSNESISIKILDNNGVEQEEFIIPSFKDRNSEGYSIITTMMDKYGFSDSIYAFDDLETAKGYKAENNKKNNR